MNTGSVTYGKSPIPGPVRVNTGGGELYFLLAFLFILYSRIFDLFLAGYKIPSIALFAACLVALLGGQVLRSFKHRTTMLWLAFTAWMVLSSFFSIWRGGSVQMLTSSWWRALVVYFLIVSIARNIDQCSRAVRTIGWAVGALVLTSLLTGSSVTGRVFLGGGKFDNPNDLAQVLLLGAPCLWLIFKRSSTFSPSRFITLPILVVLTFTILRTGSRGAMIAVFAMLIFLLFTSASKGKAALLVTVLVIAAAATLAISQPLRTRYLTLFDTDASEETSEQSSKLSEIAAASAVSRRELLQESLAFTASHPLLGVGPGMFAEARERNAHEEHRFATSLQTHNTYSQVSSECGIPAALLFITIVVYTFRMAKRIYGSCRNRSEPQLQTAAAVARALCFVTLAYAFTSFFISVAYQTLLPTLSGLVVALELAVTKELAVSATTSVPARRVAGAPAVAAPAPAVAVPMTQYPARPLGRHRVR